MAAPSDTHMVDRVADRLASSLEQQSDRLAARLEETLLDDSADVGQPAFLDHLRQHWADPRWRAQLLERMGPQGFTDAAHAAFGVPKPVPLGRLAQDGLKKLGADSVAAVRAPTQRPTPAEGPGY